MIHKTNNKGYFDHSIVVFTLIFSWAMRKTALVTYKQLYRYVSMQMRIHSNFTVIWSMGIIKIITCYTFNKFVTWESVTVRILLYFYCVLITMPVTTSNYHSWLSNLVRLSANDHSKHVNVVNVSLIIRWSQRLVVMWQKILVSQFELLFYTTISICIWSI